MRFFLGLTMFGDGYFSFTESNSHEHHYQCYYDEYELKFGKPTSDAIQLYGTGDNEQGVYVRFFEHGCVIVNIDETDRTVTNDEIKVFEDYSGPYYRFNGGQNPEFNNGAIFSSVTLDGTQIGKGFVGDAILLVDSPTTIVTDIFIDSDNDGTSPGSKEAKYTGSWIPTNDDVADAWCLSYRGYRDAYAMRYCEQGDGSNYAIFTPTVGVAGYYKIYEWHGDKRDKTEASNVPYLIRFKDGEIKGTIDQSSDYGQWNFLGTYYFNKGNDGYVKITNNANGIVIADAFKFVNDQACVSDQTPPNRPRNLKSESSTENSIKLTWSPPSDVDVAYYKVKRDHVSIGQPVKSVFVDDNLSEITSYSYEIFAVDGCGNCSTSAATGSYKTLSDTRPPVVEDVYAITNSVVIIDFNELVDKQSAEDRDNFHIDPNMTIGNAILMDNAKSIKLNTSDHDVGIYYSLTIEGIKDKSANRNVIETTSIQYVGIGNPIKIVLSADNNYSLYIDGEFFGSDGRWEQAETFEKMTKTCGKHVIAIKCTDNKTIGGFVAMVNYLGETYVTDESWKVSTVVQPDWQLINYDDRTWQNATSYGEHGTAKPWAKIKNVANLPVDEGINWIWSENYETQKEVYFRFTISSDSDDDITPPAIPTGLYAKIYESE